PDDAATERRLATARLADEPEGLASCELEVDAVDRAQDGARPPLQPADEAAAKRKVHRNAAHLELNVSHRRSPALCARPRPLGRDGCTRSRARRRATGAGSRLRRSRPARTGS